jgi:molecular chaperone DnaJ
VGFVSLHIPSGVSDGTLLPFPGLEETHEYPRPRYIRVKVSRHPFFTRKGRDVICRVPISERDAREGSTVVVRTLRGRQHRVVVPPETKNGTIMRLVGEGIESDGGRGDQLVEIRVKTPSRRRGKGAV